MTQFWRLALGSLRDLTPIVLVIFVFQLFVLERPLAELLILLEGMVLVVLGLTFFIYGLELALFPVGEAVAHALARKGSVPWLLAFAFLMGLGTSIAEPALIAVTTEAARVASDASAIADTEIARERYALGLRLTVACSVGIALVIGVSRIVMGWSLPRMIIAAYGLILIVTFAAPPDVVGIAYDAGGVTTSTVTVPLVAALGIGLASSLGGRNPMMDGFGLIAFAALMPILFVLCYGIVAAWI